MPTDSGPRSCNRVLRDSRPWIWDDSVNFDTPCVTVDAPVMERNIGRVQAAATDAGVGLRPHIKTHKSTGLARLQLEAGAVGLTCATLSEAVGLSDARVGGDLFVAVPFYPSPPKLARIDRLLEAGCDLALAVDNLSVAGLLAIRYPGGGPRLMVELDSGLRRSGVAPREAVAVAVACGDLFGGVFTHGGHGYPPGAAAGAGADEIRVLGEAKAHIETAGMRVPLVSAGSTPTMPYGMSAPITEVRPGTYLFGDWQQVSNGSMNLEDVAVAVMGTVISAPSPDRFVLDCGAKILSKDRPPWVEGYGHLPEIPGAVIERLYDNHAVVLSGRDRRPMVGDQLRVIPNHVCPVINLVDQLLLSTGEVISVDLRGHLS